MAPVIKTVRGDYIVASHIHAFRRYAALDNKPGLDLYALTRDGTSHQLIEDTNDAKEQALIDELGSWIIDPSMYEEEE